MPRVRQQTPKAPNDQAYGKRNEQTEAQAALPIPDRTPVTAPAGAPAPPGPQEAGPGGALGAALNFQPPALGPLDAPTMRPGEPVTAGAPIGAGPGPEALGFAPKPPSATLQTLEILAANSSNPAILRLLENARRRGA